MSKIHLSICGSGCMETIEKEPFRNVVLPRLNVLGKSFLGWCLDENANEIFMNFSDDKETTLEAVLTDKPAYIIESHYRGDVNDYVGERCHYRRYVVDIYMENAAADCGRLKINVCNNFLYYLGYVPTEGVNVKIDAPSRKFEGQYHFEADNFQTDYIAVEWKSDKLIAAKNGRKKIARIMLYFSRWGIGYSEIAGHTSDVALMPDRNFDTCIGDEAAQISANFYIGVKDYETSSKEDFEEYETASEKSAAENDEVLARFAVMADSHIGRRYNWENYDWLYSAFDGIKAVHKETPLDFVVQLGDNIDDGYEVSYEADYAEYLEKIKSLDICDPINPIERRAAGKIPHYELQGNHDTTVSTRFFRNKMWHTERASGEKVYFISLFAEYGGYPLVPFEITGNYDSYRSYGILSEETVAFTEKSITEAKRENAEHIVLMCHFGMAKDLFAPILPETGLGKVVQLCKKYGIKLYFNGHEHNKNFSLYSFNGIYDYDAAMTHDRYAIAEIRKKSATVTIYNSKDNSIYRTDNLIL